MRGITYGVDMVSSNPDAGATYFVTGGIEDLEVSNPSVLPPIRFRAERPRGNYEWGSPWDSIIEMIDDGALNPDENGVYEPDSRRYLFEKHFHEHYEEILKGEYDGGFRLVGFTVRFGMVTLYFSHKDDSDYCLVPIRVHGEIHLVFELPPNVLGFRPTYDVEIMKLRSDDPKDPEYEHNYTKVTENHGYLRREIRFELKDSTIDAFWDRYSEENTRLIITDRHL